MRRLGLIAPGLGLLAVALAFAPAHAAGTRECHVVVVRPVTDDIGNTWKPGTTLPVDIERDTAGGGAYCAHGGSCLPRLVASVTAVRLLDCRTGASIGGGDHRLVPLKPARRAN